MYWFHIIPIGSLNLSFFIAMQSHTSTHLVFNSHWIWVKFVFIYEDIIVMHRYWKSSYITFNAILKYFWIFFLWSIWTQSIFWLQPKKKMLESFFINDNLILFDLLNACIWTKSIPVLSSLLEIVCYFFFFPKYFDVWSYYSNYSNPD